MAENSKIEWADHTFNPWRGCTKVSDGCKNCYAKGIGKRFGPDWGPGADRVPATEAMWQQPHKWNRAAARDEVRRRVFCASMADVAGVPDILPGNIDCLSCRSDESKCGKQAKGFEPIKALSIRQPWAHFILHCGKDIENRDWPTRMFGPVLIHAAKTMTRGDYDDAVDFAKSLGVAKIPAPEDLPRGGIVGMVNINDCVIESDSPWFMGWYGFTLSNPRPLPFFPCKGQLGFFKVDLP